MTRSVVTPFRVQGLVRFIPLALIAAVLSWGVVLAASAENPGCRASRYGGNLIA